MLNKDNSILVLFPALLFVLLITYLLMSDPFIAGPY